MTQPGGKVYILFLTAA